MIDKIKNSPLNLQATSVYNFNEFSLTELLNKFFTSINECIDSSNQALKFLEWLKDEGLPTETIKELNNMYVDGRLTQAIDNLSGNLTSKIDLLNSQLEQEEIKLNEVTTELIQKVNKEDLMIETRSKRIQGENNISDTKGSFDSANFAGQTLGKNAPIGNVMHHYTDGIAFQIDNVGENNNILILKNANNPTRRGDKPEDFIGSGIFIDCINGVIGGSSKSVFRIDKNGDIIYKDKVNTSCFISDKLDDGNPVFRFNNYKEHDNIVDFINSGGTELSIRHVSNQCVLQTGNKPTNGLKLDAQMGKLELTSAQAIELKPKNKGFIDLYGVLRIQEGSNSYRRVVTTSKGSTRPTDGLYEGFMFLDTSLGNNGKPIWWNGLGWIDSNGTIV